MADPVGPDNDAWIAGAVAEPAVVVVAGWGARADSVRVWTVLDLVGGTPLFCWGRIVSGQARHPLYLPASTPLVGYAAAGLA